MMLAKILSWLRGDVTRRTMLAVLLPLMLASYFGILGVAVWLTPEAYDWRYNSISRLLYPRNNPEFHLIASISIAVSGVLMIPFAGYIRRRLHGAAPRAVTVGAAIFFAGCLLLSLAGLVTSHPAAGQSPVPKLHDLLARLSVASIGVGMVVFNACGTTGYFRPPPGTLIPRRRLLVAWNLLTVPVIVGVILWAAIRLCWTKSGPAHQALVASPVWHVGFWEWIGSAIVFLFLTCAVLFLPHRAPGHDVLD
jgi:hypothetical protein